MLRSIATKPFLSDFGILILRVVTGTLLIHHGYEKLANIENFADAFVRPLHLPFPILLSYVAAFSEVIGSWLLITGFLTRFGALAIMGTISVAHLSRHHHSRIQHLFAGAMGLYFGAAVAILAVGPGLFAIDELIVRRFSPELEREQSGSIDTVVSEGGAA